MGTYYKPQSPIQSGEDFIYPITTADQIMKSDKSRRLEQAGLIVADNSTSLGGVAAEDYALKTDTAPNSAKLGGKAPEYYLQPRNLLDNSDFRNPVNQRGKTSYKGGYGIDRWKQWSNNHTTNVQNGHITVSIIQQYIGLPIDFDAVYTMAARKTDGTILCISGTFSKKINKDGLRLDYDTNTDGSKKPYVCINAAGDYLWSALYEGSYTAETLPPYVPKGYAAELAECQRYYYRMNLVNAPCLGSGWAYRKNNRIPIVLPMTMRITPTVQMDAVSNFQIIYNKATYNATNINIQNCTFNHLTLNVVANTGIPEWDIVSSRINGTATIEFSADL